MANPMPTGAKLTAAVSFAVVGFIIANYYEVNMPDVSAVGPVRATTAAVGAFVGWQVMGNAVGNGYVEAAGAGVRTALVLIVVALFLLGLHEMLINSMKMRYDSAMEAVLDIFQTMGKRSPGLLSLGVLGTALLGGIVAGMMTERAGRIWK
jgi:hypothetical protein